MKKVYLILAALVLFANLKVSAQSIGISDVTHTPDNSSALDVYSTTKGLLIPRIALTATTSASPVTSPIASLMVYNTATTGDVTPGYYFWDGTSKWLRLMSKSDPFNNLTMVTKTADTILQKTENMVLVSGNTTLTLPAITASDDGLQITIKHIGTYTDLVSVIGNSGATIDGIGNAYQFRWLSQTYTAYDGNWFIKEKKPQACNVLDVSSRGSWTSIEEVVAFLDLHMCMPVVVRLVEPEMEINSTVVIDLPYPITIEGPAFGTTNVQATSGVSGNVMFDCQTECYFKMLTFTAYANTTGNDCIHFTGSENYHEVKDCSFNGFNKGIVSTTNVDIWVFDTDFDDHTGVGVEVAAGSTSGGSFKISECDFTQCKKGINLLSGIDQAVSILNCTFYNTMSGTDIGINYVPATFSTFGSMFISNNSWNNEGVFMSGFDFSRPDGRDADAFVLNNAGMEDESPHCKLNVTNNTATTTLTSNAYYYKANWTSNSQTYACKWAIGSTSPTSGNRITYLSKNKSNVFAIITGNIAVNASHTITLAIFKNGSTTTRFGETDLKITTANQPFQFSTVIYVPDMAETDYLELGVTSAYNGDVVTFQDIQWFTNAQ